MVTRESTRPAIQPSVDAWVIWRSGLVVKMSYISYVNEDSAGSIPDHCRN